MTAIVVLFLGLFGGLSLAGSGVLFVAGHRGESKIALAIGAGFVLAGALTAGLS